MHGTIWARTKCQIDRLISGCMPFDTGRGADQTGASGCPAAGPMAAPVVAYGSAIGARTGLERALGRRGLRHHRGRFTLVEREPDPLRLVVAQLGAGLRVGQADVGARVDHVDAPHAQLVGQLEHPHATSRRPRAGERTVEPSSLSGAT